MISSPSGAIATAGDQRITTPGTLYVPKGATEMEIRIEKPGFETAVVLLTSTSGSMKDCIDRATLSGDNRSGQSSGIGDPGIAIGTAVTRALADCSNEAAPHLEPSSVFVKLAPVAESSAPRP